MRWPEWLTLVFLVAVWAFAIGLQWQRPDSFASRWSPVLTMPSEGLTIRGKSSRGPDATPARGMYWFKLPRIVGNTT